MMERKMEGRRKGEKVGLMRGSLGMGKKGIHIDRRCQRGEKAKEGIDLFFKKDREKGDDTVSQGRGRKKKRGQTNRP